MIPSKRKQRKRRQILIIGLIVVSTTLCYLSLRELKHQEIKPSPQLTVDFFDIGQGDATLIITPYNQKILIDGGPDGKILEKLNSVNNFFDRHLNLIISTHPHADHLSGLIPVLQNYQVDQILYGPPGAKPSGLFRQFQSIAQEKQFNFREINSPQNINLGPNCLLAIIYPLGPKTSKSANDLGLVSRLDCLGHQFLFTADVEAKAEKEIINSGISIQAEVLKVGHHGSKTSSDLNFLKEIRPSLAFISVSADNKYREPAPETLEKFNQLGIKIWRSDLDGDLQVIASDQGLYTKKPQFH